MVRVFVLTQSYGFLNKQNTANAGSSSAETPILCETCLGPNPYVRMSRQHLGKECKVCGRPFTVFRWNPGAGMRFKKTEICTTCAKLKHVCQTCILDLDYHLPTHVRDAALHIQSAIPTSDINRQYYVNRMEALMDDEQAAPQTGPARGAAHATLQKLARDTPDYKRNRPQICSFYARGACTRGEACPYRHEMPSDAPRQSIADRYHGTNDVVAKHMLQRLAQAKGLTPPANEAIMSLFLSGLPEISEDGVRAAFLESVPGLHADDIRQVTLVPASHCAFVNFATRAAAERAAESLAVKVEIDGKEVRVAWGRTPAKSREKET